MEQSTRYIVQTSSLNVFKNGLQKIMGVASNRQEEAVGICKLYNDQAEQLLSLQKTKRRQTVNNYKRSFFNSSIFFAHFKVKFCYIYLANTRKDKTKSTLINKMLSSKVKMEDPK